MSSLHAKEAHESSRVRVYEYALLSSQSTSLSLCCSQMALEASSLRAANEAAVESAASDAEQPQQPAPATSLLQAIFNENTVRITQMMDTHLQQLPAAAGPLCALLGTITHLQQLPAALGKGVKCESGDEIAIEHRSCCITMLVSLVLYLR